MSFTKIDHWIGKTLFAPPIIKLCQLTHQSQFAVSRLFWFIAALDGFYRAETLFGSILWGGLSVLMMFSAAQRADSPATSFMFFRLLAIVMLAVDMVRGSATGEWAGIEFWGFVLVAEYAAVTAVHFSRSLFQSNKTSSAGRRYIALNCHQKTHPPLS
jgi:hypothetical protein